MKTNLIFSDFKFSVISISKQLFFSVFHMLFYFIFRALCNTSLKTSTNRRPGHWNVDSLRQQFDMNNADLIVSPGVYINIRYFHEFFLKNKWIFSIPSGCNSSRNGSSGFSSGEASTNSSATTPPPLMSSNMYNQHESTSSILDEAELKNAPWFQKGIPR